MSTTQPDLFGLGPGRSSYGEPLPARAADPPSSRAAAARHRASGRLGANAAAVLELVRRNGGKTYRELWDLAPLAVQEQLGSEVELMRRLGSLRARGRVEHGPERVCAIKGTKMVTWAAV